MLYMKLFENFEYYKKVTSGEFLHFDMENSYDLFSDIECECIKSLFTLKIKFVEWRHHQCTTRLTLSYTNGDKFITIYIRKFMDEWFGVSYIIDTTESRKQEYYLCDQFGGLISLLTNFDK